MSETPPPRLRLDAVAWSLLLLGALVAAALATFPPLTGREPVLGPDTALVVAPLAAALGFAAFVLLVGWFAVVVHYVRRRSAFTLAARALGWLLLVAGAAVFADHRAADFPRPGTVHGPGGALGAFLRFTLDDRTPAAAVPAILAFALLAGTLLAMPRLVVGTIRRGIRTLSFGTRAVEAGSNHVV